MTHEPNVRRHALPVVRCCVPGCSTEASVYERCFEYAVSGAWRCRKHVTEAREFERIKRGEAR